MRITRRALMAGATFFLAAATGHVMQNGETIGARLRGEAHEVSAATLTAASLGGGLTATLAGQAPTAIAADTPLASAAAIGGSLPRFPEFSATAAAALPSAVRLASRIDGLDASYIRGKSDADAIYDAYGTACTTPTLTLGVTGQALLRVSLSAPCNANERVTIEHAGLAFAVATDARGDVTVDVPAFADMATVSARFDAGEVLSATQAVAGLAGLYRVAVLWDGVSGFSLAPPAGTPALADGDTSATPEATPGSAGALLRLGSTEVDRPAMAAIYTTTTGASAAAISLEAEVSEDTCGRDLTGKILKSVPGKPPVLHDLVLAMPDCDAIGDLVAMDLAPLSSTPAAFAEAGR